MHDVGGRNTRDVCMVVCRCDFDNVRAAVKKSVNRARVAKMPSLHKVEARKAPDDPFDLARRPATRLWRAGYEKLQGLG